MTNATAFVPSPLGAGGSLALDAGSDATTVAWTDGTRKLEARYPAVAAGRPALPQVADIVRRFLDASPVAVRTLGVGACAVTTPDASGLAALLGDLGIEQVALAHDSTTSYLGALGVEPGVVVAAGTGVVTLALGETEVARVDGWGWLMGDAGSAFWIGRNALEAAMRGYDGRRQMTALTDAVAADFADIETAYLELESDPDRVRRVARYATVVDDLAATDPVARNILDKAAAHLSEAVLAGAHRVGLMRHEPPRVSVVGGLFTSQHLVHTFTEFLTLQWPNFALHEAAGTGVDGAARLTGLDPACPLSSRVSIAGR